MGKSVAINPPKTPCTTESRGVAKATIPNICKMPGPPAPFIPTPLPNIGKSSLSPKGYSKTVKIEGKTVAIRGATFESIGDIASKGTGGGLISANTHGPTKFITPGSMNVKIEGKNVHLLGEPMLNNCGPSGSPPNTGATMQGFDTWDLDGGANPMPIDCEGFRSDEKPNGYSPCEKKQICKKCDELNKQAQTPPGLQRRSAQDQADARALGDKAAEQIRRQQEAGARALGGDWIHNVNTEEMFYDECARKEWREGGRDPGMRNPMFDPDHVHEIQLGGAPANPSNFKWMSAHANRWMGRKMQDYNKPGGPTYTGVRPNCC